MTYNKRNRRGRLDVINDILNTIKNRNGIIKPTRILDKSNLSQDMMNKYLSELIEKKFVDEIKTKNGKTYSLTQKGFEYITRYRMIIVLFTDEF